MNPIRMQPANAWSTGEDFPGREHRTSNTEYKAMGNRRRGKVGLLLVFLLGHTWFAMTGWSQTITRGPYLQNETSTNIVVRWRTSSATNSRVRYGTNVTSLSFTNTDLSIVTEHEIVLNGLSPDTKYFYSVGTTSAVLAGGNTNHFFITAPVPGTVKSTRIWVLGDSGTQIFGPQAKADQQAVRDAYYAYTGSRHTDLWLMLGDNAYPNGTDSEYQGAVFNMYPTMLRKSALWSTRGNHELADGTNGSVYYAIFTLPKIGEGGGVPSGSEAYYSFDYGNIHFICLDSEGTSLLTNGAMANWLRADLAATAADWIIAYWHHPPYSKGSHNSDDPADSGGRSVAMRENFLPILEDGGVDLALTGHSHSYERSVFLDGHYGYSTNLVNSMKLNTNSGRADVTGPYIKSGAFIGHQGAVHVVCGSSGILDPHQGLNHPAMYISLFQLGSLVLDINGNQLDVKFIRETGAIDDYFTIVKADIQMADSQVLPNGNFQVMLTQVAAGKTNIIQASTNLLSWVSISTNVVSSNSFNFVDVNATNHGTRFYRVLRLP